MARRGTVKRASVEQEDAIAKRYGGKRSASSGASDHDQGDVRSEDTLFECKLTGSFDKPAKSISLKVDDLEKIVEEARSEGRTPALALRIHNPDSPLADRDGNIDLIARLMRDDCTP